MLVTERILPGVAAPAAWRVDRMDEATRHRQAGADNYLDQAVPTDEGHSGWNSCNVQVEKWNGPNRSTRMRLAAADPAPGGEKCLSNSASTSTPAACTNCRACAIACKDKNNNPVGVNFRRVFLYGGGSWLYPQAGFMQPINVFNYSVSLGCQHCEDPACIPPAPPAPSARRADGW